MSYQDRNSRDKKERKEPRVYSPSNYSAYNKEWICVDDSGRVLSHGKDLYQASGEAKQKVGKVGFILHYIDLEVTKK